MRRNIKVCIDRVLPEELRRTAAQRAIEENPGNLPVSRVSPMMGVAIEEPQRIAVLTGKKWLPGRELKVHFLDGHPDVQAKVEQYAHEWSKYANIKFNFGYDPSAEIRISFEEEGSWSYIGTDALSIYRPKPTMNFGWLTPSTPNEEYSRVVIHEFGHALGCIHEHQHPEVEIPWNVNAVYDYYAGPPNYWTKSMVDYNIFEKYSKEGTNFSQYDRNSIMHYSVPKELTDGVFEIGMNKALSDMDKEFISAMYKFEEPPMPILELGGAPLDASIGKHGEEDLFKFAVTKQDRYILETEGKTDVVMSLLGPNSQTELVAEDDDSGRFFNARIAVELIPGTYYVRVRHYRPKGTGGYKIWARSE